MAPSLDPAATGDNPPPWPPPRFAALRRAALRVAYAGLRLAWFLRRPSHRGAMVGLWQDGKVLLLRNSYRRAWNLPGGGIGRRETPVEAASRELREEIGLAIPTWALGEARRFVATLDHRRDEIHVFTLAWPEGAVPRPDGIEVTGWMWGNPAALPAPGVPPHVERYIAWAAVHAKVPRRPDGRRGAPRERSPGRVSRP